MSSVFSPLDIGTLRLPNRFIRSATAMGMADEHGACTDELVSRMAQLAAGGVGLIVSGAVYISPDGHTFAGQLGCDSDAMMDGLAELVGAVHRQGGFVAQQIMHGGAMAGAAHGEREPAGPSRYAHPSGKVFEAMSQHRLQATIEAFAQAARRVRQAGFDAIQLHAAHGYLLSQFLSPAFNQREDDYGGSLANRARLLLEVISAVRQAVGVDYPVMCKLNVDDRMENGLVPGEARQVCLMLEDAGVDAIEISGGTTLAFARGRPEDSWGPVKKTGPYWRADADGIAETLDIPLILVGGIRSLAMAKEIIASGVADAVSMCRPFVREPSIIKRWQSGDTADSDCVSCNGCIGALVKGQGTHCIRP